MGDASSITLFSVVPLLIAVTSIIIAIIAWRSGRRAIRTIVAILLILFGVPCVLATAGLFFSVVAGAVIGGLGLALLIAEYGPKRAS